MKHKYSPNIGDRGVTTLPGPNKKKNKNFLTQKGIRKIQTFLLVLQVVSILFGVVGIAATSKANKVSSIDYYDETNISFINLNDSEINDANLLINSIPEYFLSPVREIVFVKDDFYCEKYEYDSIRFKWLRPKQAHVVGDTVIGLNSNDYVIVEWNNDMITNANTLCHEILHSYFRYPNGGVFEDDSHAAMDFIADEAGCYDDLNLNKYTDKDLTVICANNTRVHEGIPYLPCKYLYELEKKENCVYYNYSETKLIQSYQCFVESNTSYETIYYTEVLS